MRGRRLLFLLVIGLICTSISYGQNDLVVEKLGQKINSDNYDEITPVLNHNGKVLTFTRNGYPTYDKTLIDDKLDLAKTLSRRAYQKRLRNIYSTIAGYEVKHPEKSPFNQDIWIAYAQNEDFDIVTHPGYPLNNALPNSVCAITPDDKAMVVINQFSPDGGMGKGYSMVYKEHNDWSFPYPMFISNYTNEGTDVGLTMSTDGNVIIMTLQKNDGSGNNDLYVSMRTGDFSWSEPVSLGPNINSQYRETTPFLTIDKSTLYFSSNRPGGYGGNDIYYAKRINNSWTEWTTPKPMKSPVNSESDDSQPFFDINSGFLYLSSKRDGTSDIFRVRIEKPLKETVTVKGKVMNPKNEELIEDVKILRAHSNSENYEEVQVSQDGFYSMELSKGSTYDIKAIKSGHISRKASISFNKDYVYLKDYTLDLSLEPMEKGTKINLKPIYFKQSKPVILQESFGALDELAQFLKKNKNMYIIIEGHTDNQGKEEDLLQLSKERAEAIKEYLVYKKRIKPVRLTTEGYGAERPVNNNLDEAQRAINRRVEVYIDEVASMLKTKRKTFPAQQ
jgi:outer membrane protein OmpA-like peptidoglycan-associated protein